LPPWERLYEYHTTAQLEKFEDLYGEAVGVE